MPKPNLVMGILKKLQMRVRQQLSKLLDWPTRPDILSAIHDCPQTEISNINKRFCHLPKLKSRSLVPNHQQNPSSSY